MVGSHLGRIPNCSEVPDTMYFIGGGGGGGWGAGVPFPRTMPPRSEKPPETPPQTPLIKFLSECLFFFGVFLSMLARAAGP